MIDLSIIVPSYNREKYIAQMFHSIFEQKTEYSFQIIVVDDCSTDRTVKVIQQFQREFPEKIILLESKENQMLYKNVLRAYAMIKSEYFCVIDPDDFWIDSFKIQKALTFLEANEDYTIYATATLTQDKHGERKPMTFGKLQDSDFNDYLQGKAQLGNTLGSVFRNVIFKNGIPSQMTKLINNSQEDSFRGDSFRSIIHLHEGKCHFVPDYDGVYRITKDGLWQASSSIDQVLLTCFFYIDMFHYYDKKYWQLVAMSYIEYGGLKNIMDQELARISSAEKRQKVLSKIKKLADIFKILSLK